MNENFLNAFSGTGTMYGGRPPTYTPDLNITGMLGMSGPQAMVANMAIQPMVGQMLGPQYVPAQFSPTANLYDQYRAKSLLMSQQQAMRVAAQQDRTVYYDMFRGVAMASGSPFGIRESRAAGKFADDMAAMAPYIAPMMPDMFDKLHGSRGSSLLMAQMVSAGARYGVDPVTGLRGMSGESVNNLVTQLSDQMYGPASDIKAMRGLTAGRAGQLYDELQRRGLMGGGSRDAGLATLASQLGKPMDEIKNMPDLPERLRSMDVSRTKDKLSSMAGVVAAMQDLFGEMGEPNAPMSKLLNAVEALSQGGLSTMRPERVEQMVRQASNVARAAGASLESLFQLSAAMTGKTDSLGLDRSFATRSAVGGMAFADAFGRTMGGLKGFGLMGKDQMTMLGAQLEANAAASGTANQLAAVTRLGSEFKAFDVNGDTDAARMYRAISNGQDTFVDQSGKTRSVGMALAGPNGLTDLMTKSGVSTSLFERVIGQTASNQTTLANNSQLVRITRRMQSQNDIAPRLIQEFSSTFAEMGGDDATRRALAVAATEVGSGLLSLDRDSLQKVNDQDFSSLVKIAEDSLTRQGIKVTPQMRGQLEQQVRLGMSQIDERIKIDPGMRGYKSRANLLAVQNTNVLRETEYAQREAEVEASMQTSFSRLGRSDFVQRISDLLQKAGPNTGIKDVLASALGYQPTADVQGALEGPLGKVKADMDALAAMDPNKDKGRVQQLLAQVAAGGPAGAQAQAELNKLTEFYGTDATQIVRMEARDLQLSARARAARSIDRDAPQLIEALKKANLTNSRLGGKDADNVLRLLQLNNRSGIVRAGNFAGQVLVDEQAMKAMGEEGLGLVQGLMSSSKALQDKANELTGGDVEKLLQGDFKGTDEQKQEVMRLKKQAEESTTAIGKALASGKDRSSEWSEDYKKRLGQYRSDMTKSGEMALSELFGLSGKKDVLDKAALAEIAQAASKSDVLQSALSEARGMRAEAAKKGGGAEAEMAEYVSMLRKRGGVFGLVADAAEGKAVPPELLGEEISKSVKKEEKPKQVVSLAPDTQISGTLDITTGDIVLKPKVSSPTK